MTRLSHRTLLGLLLVSLTLAGCGLFGIGGGKTTNRTLRTERLNDPAVNEAIPSALEAAGWKERVVASTVHTRTWNVARHPVSGAIVKRTVGADVLAQLPGQDHCRVFSLSFKQAYDGARYGLLELNGVGDSVKVDCQAAQPSTARR